MTHDELITVARTHTVDFPKLSGEAWANQETLTKVAALDAVAVSFESDQHMPAEPEPPCNPQITAPIHSGGISEPRDGALVSFRGQRRGVAGPGRSAAQNAL